MAEPAIATTTLTVANVGPSELARVEEVGISVDQLVARVKKIRDVRDKVMRVDCHFGKIPGVDKPTLLKPGAETLCMAFQLAPKFDLDERREGDHLEVVVTCTLIHAPSGTELGNGVGSCSTRESKYAYRKAQRRCPKCGKESIIKGQEKYGGGWLCWKKKDGCGAKFADGDRAIESQQAGRVPNEDIADQWNTVRKMACKRAHVAATLFVTGASELFTQDVEEMVPGAEPEPAAPPDDGEPPPPLPTAAELDAALAALDAASTSVELTAAANAHKGKAWTDAQRKKLRAAMAAKTKALMDSESSEFHEQRVREDEQIRAGREPGEDG